MSEQPGKPIAPEIEEGEWTVRAGQAYPAGVASPFATVTGPPGLTVGNLFRRAQDEAPDQPRLVKRSDPEVESLDYSNPFRQNLERVWFDGKIIYAAEQANSTSIQRRSRLPRNIKSYMAWT